MTPELTLKLKQSGFPHPFKENSAAPVPDLSDLLTALGEEWYIQKWPTGYTVIVGRVKITADTVEEALAATYLSLHSK